MKCPFGQTGGDMGSAGAVDPSHRLPQAKSVPGGVCSEQLLTVDHTESSTENSFLYICCLYYVEGAIPHYPGSMR